MLYQTIYEFYEESLLDELYLIGNITFNPDGTYIIEKDYDRGRGIFKNEILFRYLKNLPCYFGTNADVSDHSQGQSYYDILKLANGDIEIAIQLFDQLIWHNHPLELVYCSYGEEKINPAICCYIRSQKDTSPLPVGINKDNTLFYPEAGMTTHYLFYTMRPDGKNIITDSPFLVSLYKEEEVFYYNGTDWVNPNFQTYRCSYNIILNRLFNYKNTIPQAVLGSKECTNIMGHAIK